MINLFQPAVGREELQAIERVFASCQLGRGSRSDKFESDFASHLGNRRSLVRSTSSCTEGLFQAMTLVGVGPGDQVILPSISYVGAANAVAASGALPVFCDVDERTLNTSAGMIEEKITRSTKAVIVLHYGGVACEMDEICDLVERRRLALIEDCANAIATRYAGKACGTFGDVGVWSFDSAKIVVTGEGGMIHCRTEEMARQAEQLLYLGLASASGFHSTAKTRWWELDVARYGRRAITNDIASAMGIEQLRKLPRFLARRKRISAHYDRALANLGWLKLPPKVLPQVEPTHYLYWIQTRPGLRDELASFMLANDIYTTFYYYPLHRVALYGSTAKLPNADEAAESTLCIPVHQSLSQSDVDKIVECITDFGSRYA